MKTKREHIVKELTPDLAKKIYNSIMAKHKQEQAAKPIILHHLKQLKAQMGKSAKNAPTQLYRQAILDCMNMIDAKIQKIS